MKYLRLVLGPTASVDERVARVYDFISTHNALGESGLYLNFGWWDGAVTLDEAHRRLAEVLGERAELGPGDVVLDCGFGFGDQDIFWMERFKPRHITGLNIAANQVAMARRRVSERGLSRLIDLQEGSATSMPFPSRSFDKVVVLEAAFHFDTREDFFRESFRVLQPGGRLAMMDVLPLADPAGSRRLSVKAWIGRWVDQRFWRIPESNLYDREEFSRRLSAAGFTDIRVESVAERVYPGYIDCVRRRVADPAVKARGNPLSRFFYTAALYEMRADYVLVTACKPGEAP